MKCKTPIQRLLFNMVEVVIALVIVMVALIGIMGMIPHGIEANYNAMTRSSAADAADQFLHYMASRVEQDWVETEAFPDAKNADASSGLIFSDKPLLENDRLLIQFEAANAESEWLDEDSGIAEMINNKGIFKIAQRTAANTTDFTGEIRAWRKVYEVGPGGEETTTKNPGNKEVVPGEGEGDDRWRNGKKVIMAHYPPGQDGKTCHTLSRIRRLECIVEHQGRRRRKYFARCHRVNHVSADISDKRGLMPRSAAGNNTHLVLDRRVLVFQYSCIFGCHDGVRHCLDISL